MPFLTDEHLSRIEELMRILVKERKTEESEYTISANDFITKLVEKYANSKGDIPNLQTGDRQTLMKYCNELVQEFHGGTEIKLDDGKKVKFLIAKPKWEVELTDEQWAICRKRMDKEIENIAEEDIPLLRAHDLLEELCLIDRDVLRILVPTAERADRAMCVAYLQAIVTKAIETSDQIEFPKEEDLEKMLHGDADSPLMGLSVD
ncbi:hypothetical protein EJ08DRAFT_661012 [Tothia fuscella]|uniref:Uncharacterized protein n=1 Tax=Tothia fuscella TaxID=1048955 RepID=A0A9P4NQN7_9PEZI|nr:hypothetical protein EJ08DRAFT_661012 [Tothia fuscella]